MGSDSKLYRGDMNNTNIRGGLLISFYCLPNIMISWKIGLEYSKFKYDKSYPTIEKTYPLNRFGICGKDKTTARTIFNNFGFYVFF